MNKTEINLDTLNKISEKFVNDSIDPARSIIKVTTESYYIMYEKTAHDVETITKEWFDIHGNSSHAYRDESKFPYTNLVKIERIHREFTEQELLDSKTKSWYI